MSQQSVLFEVVAALDRAGITYMVVGSFGGGFHGEFRATQGADIVIDPTREQLRRFLDGVGADFYVSDQAAEEALARRSQFNLVHFETAWKVDLIIRKDRAFSRSEFARRRDGELGGREVSINSPEDVILSKLEWAKMSRSVRQIADAGSVIDAYGDSLDWEYVHQWAGELGVDDLLRGLLEARERTD